ncbi:MAG: tRNA pseudouridine(38-40) synthase TruA [Terriglobia bacterium]
MRNLCLVIAYDGTDFHGWQRQPNAPTVQGCLEEALTRITAAEVKLYGSGRTDAGVHATGQVANFRTECRIPGANLQKALNDLLPPSVRVKEVSEVAEDFHARYHARAKMYRYRILQAPLCSPFFWRFVDHYPYPLDHRRMAEAARRLEGEHDFTSFAASSGDEDDDPPGAGNKPAPPGSPPKRAPSMVRTIFSSRFLWRPRMRLLTYEVRGNGFLHHMVRNIAGTLIEVGRGKLAPADVSRILEARDRSLAGPTAPARGLCLMKVEY